MGTKITNLRIPVENNDAVTLEYLKSTVPVLISPMIFYFSPAGNDVTGTGEESNTFASITGLINFIKGKIFTQDGNPGYGIGLRFFPGTYNLNSLNDLSSGIFSQLGRYITIEGYDNTGSLSSPTIRDSVILNFTVGENYLTEGFHSVLFRNLTLQSNGGASSFAYAALSLYYEFDTICFNGLRLFFSYLFKSAIFYGECIYINKYQIDSFIKFDGISGGYVHIFEPVTIKLLSGGECHFIQVSEGNKVSLDSPPSFVNSSGTTIQPSNVSQLYAFIGGGVIIENYETAKIENWAPSDCKIGLYPSGSMGAVNRKTIPVSEKYNYFIKSNNDIQTLSYSPLIHSVLEDTVKDVMINDVSIVDENRVAQLPIITPDYGNMETTNRTAGENSTWTVDRNGFVCIGGAVGTVTSPSIYVRVNSKVVIARRITGVSCGLEVREIIPVSMGDVIQVSTGYQLGDHFSYFIPPKFNHA